MHIIENKERLMMKMAVHCPSGAFVFSVLCNVFVPLRSTCSQGAGGVCGLPSTHSESSTLPSVYLGVLQREHAQPKPTNHFSGFMCI